MLGSQRKADNSSLHGFELHRPSSKGTKLLLQVIKAIINRFHCHVKTNPGFVDCSEGVRQTGRMSSTTDTYRAGILDGRRHRQIGRLQLPRHNHSG